MATHTYTATAQGGHPEVSYASHINAGSALNRTAQQDTLKDNQQFNRVEEETMLDAIYGIGQVAEPRFGSSLIKR
jgi:hypothetical protein